MKRHLNTLFVTTPGAYLRKRGGAVVVDLEGNEALHVPLHGLGSIVCFGSIGASPALLGTCAEAGVPVSFLSQSGRLQATVHGATHGNVLLRREQYRWADLPERCVPIARAMVAAKIANARTSLLRSMRDSGEGTPSVELRRAVDTIGGLAKRSLAEDDLDRLRGIEGEAAATYFGVFDQMVTSEGVGMRFAGRYRRPPPDPVNALLSFVYALLLSDARAACEAAGLDSAVGFLHRDRPGRPSLALDLMEEFRPVLADRLVLGLINRQQVKVDDFVAHEAGGVRLSDEARRAVLTAYQRRKQDGIRHPFLGEETTVGLLVHLQARLLARLLRGDLNGYPAFVWR